MVEDQTGACKRRLIEGGDRIQLSGRSVEYAVYGWCSEPGCMASRCVAGEIPVRGDGIIDQSVLCGDLELPVAWWFDDHQRENHDGRGELVMRLDKL
jgi:hypothetical protein